MQGTVVVSSSKLGTARRNEMKLYSSASCDAELRIFKCASPVPHRSEPTQSHQYLAARHTSLCVTRGPAMTVVGMYI